MDDPLLNRSSSVKASFTSYCTGSMGRYASNGGDIPFTLPDDKDDSGSDGYETPNGSLAQHYDLGSHLDSDRTTASADTAKGAVESTVTASSARDVSCVFRC